MKIIVDAGGQTCNRLWGYVGSIYESLDREEKIIILIPDKTINSFPNLLKNKNIYFPLYSKFLLNLLGEDRYFIYINIFKKIFINQYLQILYSILSFNLLKFIKGKDTWSYVKDYSKHKEKLQNIFKPSNSIIAKIDKIFVEQRTEYDIIIGIHIRWGDYKNWKNGKYYYNIEYYKLIMDKLVEVYSNKKIVFFIATNGKINLQVLEGLNAFIIESSSAIEDLYGLSICDKIVGPVSSFSTWASFIGEVPYMCLNKFDKNIVIQDNLFSITANWNFSVDGFEYDRT